MRDRRNKDRRNGYGMTAEGQVSRNSGTCPDPSPSRVIPNISHLLPTSSSQMLQPLNGSVLSIRPTPRAKAPKTSHPLLPSRALSPLYSGPMRITTGERSIRVLSLALPLTNAAKEQHAFALGRSPHKTSPDRPKVLTRSPKFSHHIPQNLSPVLPFFLTITSPSH